MTRDEATKSIRDAMDCGDVLKCLEVMAHEMSGEEYNLVFLRDLAKHLKTWYADEPHDDACGMACKTAIETITKACDDAREVLA